MKNKKEGFYKIGNYLYYAVSKEEYKKDIVFSIIWDIILLATIFYLIINLSGWWVLLVLLGRSPDKIVKEEISQ